MLNIREEDELSEINAEEESSNEESEGLISFDVTAAVRENENWQSTRRRWKPFRNIESLW